MRGRIVAPLAGTAILAALFTGLTWYALDVGTTSTAGQWCWNPPPADAVVDGYRIYYAADTLPECWGTYIEISYDQACVLDGQDGLCCYPDVMPSVLGEKVLYVVTAFNESGESPTEHGPVCP